ncbi:MAG: hypothetical protein MUE50_27680 [Pirellulaceae bacterium]|jgi:hypothetical protein|nr:hypothetical protein [Pirellulaceae bacterium]
MIPTQYKSKLPRPLSYPIGAEALSAALVGAPHAESFSVFFYERPVEPASRFQTILAQKHPYVLLVAEYRTRKMPGYTGAQFMIDRGWYGEKWEVTVYPVLRELRHEANRLLRDGGLPLVAQWLRSSAHAGWLSRDQRIELVFNPAEETLSAQESSGV